MIQWLNDSIAQCLIWFLTAPTRMFYSNTMRSRNLDNIIIILVGTKHPGNIGSVARAMHNMGLSNLRLVAPQCTPNEESERLACGGKSVLESIRTYRTLRSALRGVHFIVGATGKRGGHRSQTASPRSLAPRIIAHAKKQKAGILFGPEDTGLVDDDLLLCQMLLRIPTDPAAHSINLAQAVMIVSYELHLASLDKVPAHTIRLVPAEQVEAMYAQLEQSLLRIGFLSHQNARHMMFSLRRFMGRAGLEAEDVGILRGIARQIAWYAGATTFNDPPKNSHELHE
jgi:TrmH family RNA methyltransferase